MKNIFLLIVSALILGLLFTGCSGIANISSPVTVNTDGDLSRCVCVQSDTATGLGSTIKPKGTWFMYNTYGEDDAYWWFIQAGNPKNGLNIMGEYWIEINPDGSYTARYWIAPTFEVVDEHLGISDNPDFTAKPGRDDNANFYEPFDDPDVDGDGIFYVFAHFAVECK